MKKLALAAAFALAGCSSTKVFHSAFDDITHDTRATVGDFSTYRQLITLNGLMPMHVPGMLFYEPTMGVLQSWLQKESPGLLVGISPKRSMVVEARYDAEDPEKAVADAQQSYQTLRTKAVTAVVARLRVALFGALAQAKDDNDIRTLARQLNLSQEKPGADEIAKMKQAAMKASEEARTELETAQAALSAKLGHNIMVARWTKKEDFQGFAKIADFIGLGTGRQFEESGVLILAGIRVLNTFFGEDLFCMARNARQNPAQWDHMKRVSITVNMIQARAVGYVSDLDVAHTLALSLDITKERLEQLLKDGLLDAAGEGAKIRAEMLVATAMGVSNFGRMVKPAVEQRKTRFYPAARQVEELEEELQGKGRYVTVSVTRAQFTEKMLEGLADAANNTICNEELEPGRSLTETVARAGRQIETSASAAANMIGRGKQELPQGALLRRTLSEKLAVARTTVAACRERIAEIDQDVTDALAAEMTAGEDDREARRYRVRISQLERDQDGASILAFLNRISNELYEAHLGLRAADQLRRERQDPSAEVHRAVLALGVKPEQLKLADSGAAGAPAGARKALFSQLADAAPESKLQAAYCPKTRPSRAPSVSTGAGQRPSKSSLDM